MLTIPANMIDTAVMQNFISRHSFWGEDARHDWRASSASNIRTRAGVNSPFNGRLVR